MPESHTATGTDEFDSRFPRRLMFATAAAGVVASVVVADAPAQSAPATSPWLLGGNGSITISNFLGIKSPGIPLVFKTTADAASPMSEKMRLTAVGRLGLGVTAPVARVDVVSSTTAIQGKSSNTSASGRGVVGSAPRGFGVLGQSANNVGVSGTGGLYGVTGYSDDSAATPGGASAGLRGDGSTGVIGNGIIGVRGIGSNWAIYSEGDAIVTGTLVKAAGSFRIDHPQDPDNRWLSHSFVESPDMMNVYNGNITTDATGTATVTLPAYFSALNRDFRYQLTVIGDFAQAVVSSKVNGNIFSIRTDKPGVEVSWQVTGIRQDAYATEHPIVVETPKDAGEQGTRQFVEHGSNAKRWQPGLASPVGH